MTEKQIPITPAHVEHSKSVFDDMVSATAHIINYEKEVCYKNGLWYVCTGHDGYSPRWQVVEDQNAVESVLSTSPIGQEYMSYFANDTHELTIH